MKEVKAKSSEDIYFSILFHLKEILHNKVISSIIGMGIRQNLESVIKEEYDKD